jgi:acyl-CoA thioesterase
MSTAAELELARQCAAAMLERDACTRAFGIDIDIPAPGRATAAMTLRADMLNGFGVGHGGMVFALADTAFAFACNAANDETLSVGASIEWLEAVHAGDRLLATASEDERRGRHGFYTVRVHRQDGVLVALFRGHSVSRGRPLLDEEESDTD